MANISLGDRMKQNYESVTNYSLVKRMPVIVRVDGKCFHQITKECEKPFDEHFITCMYLAADTLAREMQGFKLAYIQSDEASFLLTDYDNLQTQGWFNYELRKIISVSAAIMSAEFSGFFRKIAYFDSRVFNMPREELANYFLWRAQDWQRNSIQMYARSFFSHKECHKKNAEDLHEMLHSIGKNWTNDLTSVEKNGRFILKDLTWVADIIPKYDEIVKIIPDLGV